MAARGTVIQGYFPNGVQRIAGRGAASRPSPNGTITQLPPQLTRFNSNGGQRLPDEVRQKMESFFGASFAEVRVHVGPQAATIGAVAFTQGTNIHFAPGQYDPGTSRGQQILGHELTHVVQQRAGRVQNPFGSGVAVVQNTMLEAEADRMGARAASAPGAVQRKLARGPVQLAKPGMNPNAKPFVMPPPPPPQPTISRAAGFVAIRPPAGTADAEYTWCRTHLAGIFAGQNVVLRITNGRHRLFESHNGIAAYYEYYDYEMQNGANWGGRQHQHTGLYFPADQ